MSIKITSRNNYKNIGIGKFSDFDGFFVANRDDTNFVRIRIVKTGADTVDFKLEAGQFMILWNKKMDVNTTEAAFAAFVDFLLPLLLLLLLLLLSLILLL